jgi:pimeloyl-ACP methyl ester carboxylesterase
VLKWIVAAAALLYLVVCGLLAVFQRSLLYFPQPRTNRSAPTITLPVAGASLVVTTRASTGIGAVLYFGGNAEDVSWSSDTLAEAFPDRALYLPHYRGYGGSSGTPSEAGLLADALALFDYVQRTYRDIVVVGRSLGSGVATYVAAQRPVSRLVLVTPFDSIVAVAAAYYWFVPVRWLLKDKYESLTHAPHVTAPTLIVAAAQDEQIPPRHATELLRHFRAGVATLEMVAGAGHNNIEQSPAYVPLLAGRARKPSPARP